MTTSPQSPPTPDAIAANAARAGLLTGRRILVTGVLSPRSIAFGIAEAIQQAGGEVVLTSFGRASSLTEKSARRLSPAPDVLELDVTNQANLDGLASAVGTHWDHLDGIVHAIGFAPEECLGGGFLTAPWESVATAFQISSYSLVALTRSLLPLMGEGSSVVSLTFDASRAWPLYDWMGPAKAALESASRYLARDLGPRHICVNTIAAGPLETIAAKAIPGFAQLRTMWDGGAPLGWDSGDSSAVADCALYLLSPLCRATTGEVFFVDGGFHSQGAPSSLGETL